MKQLLLLISGIIFLVPHGRAQDLQNQRKTIVYISEWNNCGYSYSPWSKGLIDTLVSVQNKPGFPAYLVQYDQGPNYNGLNDLIWTSGTMLPFGGISFVVGVDDRDLHITETGYHQFNAAGTALAFTKAVDTISKYVQQYTSAPSAASVGMEKVVVSSDSVVIKTKVRFNLDDSASFTAAVYVMEDSALGWQAETTGADTFAVHRNMIRTALGGGAFGNWIVYDARVHAGDAVTREYPFKIPAGWNASKLKFLYVVYRRVAPAATASRIVNTTDGDFIPTTGVQLPTVMDRSDELIVYPVPADRNVHVMMNTTGAVNNASIDLYDISGRHLGRVYNGDIQPYTAVSVTLPESIAPGNYMLQVSNATMSAVKQVVVR